MFTYKYHDLGYESTLPCQPSRRQDHGKEGDGLDSNVQRPRLIFNLFATIGDKVVLLSTVACTIRLERPCRLRTTKPLLLHHLTD